MENKKILKELAIYIFNNVGKKGDLKNISQSIYATLAYGKEIPQKANLLIPDKRYHKQFPIVYGFKWYLSKLKEPPFYVYMAIIKEHASELRLPFINLHTMTDLILHTLIVDFFEENPNILKQ